MKRHVEAKRISSVQKGMLIGIKQDNLKCLIAEWIPAALVWFAVLNWAEAGEPNRKTDSEPIAFAVSIHIATAHPSDSDQRVNAYLNTANQYFVAAGVVLKEVSREILPDAFSVLETQRERHLLKPYFVPNTINVFFIDEILDPTPSAATRKAAAWQGRKPSGRLAGAVIEYKKKHPGIYIILSRAGSPLSLAHELGHLLGCAHSKDPKNIMSYGAQREYFTEQQLKTFRTTAKRHRRNKTLKIAP
jgi:hypothetical protein